MEVRRAHAAAALLSKHTAATQDQTGRLHRRFWRLHRHLRSAPRVTSLCCHSVVCVFGLICVFKFHTIYTYFACKLEACRVYHVAGSHYQCFTIFQPGVFNVLGKKPMIRTLQCATNPKFHLAIDNGKVMGLVSISA